MLGITKRFPGVTANDRVDFSARWGELHALIGENGAGKTTLMNALYGLHALDAGEIRISGEPARITSSKDAIALGIGMVHQHFMLVEAFTALENIILGATPTRLGRTDYLRAETEVSEVRQRFGLAVDLRAKVADLSVSSQQKVEILKALYRRARILILDEPTSVLAPQEAESLFEMLRRMTAEGMCVILISHRLRDVMGYSDRVTILRNGKSVACMDTASTTADELAGLMVGGQSEHEAPVERAASKESGPVLTVRDLSVEGRSGIRAVDSIAFEVRRGEIMGVAGVDGNGQRELAEALIGQRRASGRVSLDGREILGMTVRERLDAGIAYVPEDRGFALVPDDSLSDNSILGLHTRKPFSARGILHPESAREHASNLVAEFDIRAKGIESPVRFLSGGNQQKLVLGRSLYRSPKLLVACQPTRGLDVHASAEIHSRLLAERARGAGILLISYDLDEILALSDRIMVMYRGQPAGIMSAAEATRESIGALMMGAGCVGSNVQAS